MKSTCPLCSSRKAKRACPGVHRDICTVCCGTKRLTEIACPPDCPYLATARVHPPAVVQRQQERDMEFLLPRIGDLSETQYRLLLYVQAIVLQQARSIVPSPHDSDVAEAVATVAATLETASKGIIYQHQAQSLPAQRLVTDITRAIGELAERGGAQRGRIERDAATALRRLERLAREARGEVPDEAAPDATWIGLATRLMRGDGSGSREASDAGAGQQADDRPDRREPEGPRIVIP
jgi:hypothetical protein